MQTKLATHIKDTAQGREAEAILRSCVHCGFCTATCPTYQLLGDELDGPRGRIYLIKQVLEGHAVSAKTQLHLDRCLTCRSCETTCPSGVRYGRLVDIGREIVEARVPRPWPDRLLRRALRWVVPYRERFATALRLGRGIGRLIPATWRRSMPPAARVATVWPTARHARRMLVLDGCVQPVTAPSINAAAARVLDALGISVLRSPDAGCCGALSHHMGAAKEAQQFMRRNIDAWWPQIEAGAEAIIMTASGCGAVVKDYGLLLRDDPAYSDKAARVSALTKDLAEVLVTEDLQALAKIGAGTRVALHAPCTLQHGQQLTGLVESLLTRCGFQLTPVADGHLCCGAAGTYAILQRELSQQLLRNKLNSLRAGAPQRIVTANIGCQLHLQSGTEVPVQHWVELLDQAMNLSGLRG